MHPRSLLAVTALVVSVVSFSCGGQMTADAGTGGGTGGSSGGGTGGGTGGGGSATGGGGGRTCTVSPFLPTDNTRPAGFDVGTANIPPYNYVTFIRNSATAGRMDGFLAELYVDAPINNLAIPAKNYAQCDHCFYILLGCDNTGMNCSKQYLAQSGTLSVSAATKNPDAGSFAFTLSNVVYEEWDFTADRSVDGGCITQASFAFSGSWP